MSNFTVFVAIDISGGKVVRLKRGDYAELTVYSDDPAEVAASWQERGARWLHVIDLDAALDRPSDNTREVERILDAVTIPVQLGGGMRSIEKVKTMLERGAARVVVGTRSLEPDFLSEALQVAGDRLCVALDAKGSEVMLKGWKQGSGVSVIEGANRMCKAGVSRVMVTDITRDGTLEGVNVPTMTDILKQVDIPIIASGGVGSLDDIRDLTTLTDLGLEGVIVGKALYSGDVKLEDALATAGTP